MRDLLVRDVALIRIIAGDLAQVLPQVLRQQFQFFAIVLWIVIIDMLRMSLRLRSGKSVLPLSESKYVKTQLDPNLVASSH